MQGLRAGRAARAGGGVMKVAATTPRILLTPAVDQRVRHWIELAAGEVSCLGLADQVDRAFLISEVYLLKQSCGAAETEIEQSAVGTLLTELDAAGIDIGRVRFWFHSHGALNVFWSSTDHATVERLATGDWFVSLVMNKAGACLARLDMTRPVRVTLDDVPVDVVSEDLGLRAECERLFRERVTEVAMPVLITAADSPVVERRLMDEGRITRERFRGLDWDDLDDLLGPEVGDGRLDVGL